MALDTFDKIVGRVQLQCPSAGDLLASQWVSHGFRQIAERRPWSWLIKPGQFVLPAVYNTGTVTVTQNSTTVVGSGTVWTTDMVDRQFRVGTSGPIYSIAQVNSSTSLDLDLPYGKASGAGASYEIYQAYVKTPADFHSFISVIDPANNWQLWLNFKQEDLDLWDAQRANSGNAYMVVPRDYSRSYDGTIGSILQVRGTGDDPVSSGTFTGPSDAIFTIEVTTGGASATAEYKWKKDAGAYTSGVVTSDTAQDLKDGVQVYWPLALTYVVGDVFIIRATALSNPGLPRYELWPHKKADYVYSYIYEARATDLEDGGVLPRHVRGDVLIEHSLWRAAAWPGTDGKKNPYYDLNLARFHKTEAERMIAELERQDDEVFARNFSYARSLPYAPVPWVDSAWLQSHDI